MISETVRKQHVLVMHAEPIVAAGLSAALQTVPQFDVVVGGRHAIYEDPARVPDVVVSDYASGIQLASELRAGRRWSVARVGVVVLAGKPREFEVHAALSQGVLGYLVTGCGVDELIGAVSAASSGNRYLCHAVAQQIANGMTSESLTSRERDVLRLLAGGSCNKAIASQLAIAVGTVKAHVRGIMSKLNATSRTEAASIAARRGLLEDLPQTREMVMMQ